MENSKRWQVRTESGSRYVVEEVDNEWWVSGENVPNPHSLPLPLGRWAIERPAVWPPVIGEPTVFLAVYDLRIQFDNPKRIPGGGKRTSPVTDVEELP